MSGTGMARVELSLKLDDMRAAVVQFLDEHASDLANQVRDQLAAVTPEAVAKLVRDEVDRAVKREVESRVRAEVHRKAEARVAELLSIERNMAAEP